MMYPQYSLDADLLFKIEGKIYGNRNGVDYFLKVDLLFFFCAGQIHTEHFSNDVYSPEGERSIPLVCVFFGFLDVLLYFSIC